MQVFTGITILVVILSFIKRNTEEFPYPDSCFNCNNKSCGRFSPLDTQDLLKHQKELKPIACQPISCLQYIEAITPMDKENLANW